MGYVFKLSRLGVKKMDNIDNYLNVAHKDLKPLYKKLFFLQYKYLFMPELCLLLKYDNLFSESSRKYVITLNRGLFDHCIFLLRSKDLNKDTVDIIRDLYMQLTIYNFDSNESLNKQIKNIGARNIPYSKMISENFSSLDDKEMLKNILPYFNLGNKNLMMEEIRNNYSE